MKLSENKTVDLLLKVGGGLAIFFYGDKVFAKSRKKGSESKITKKIEVSQAQAVRQAINPSGVSWMKYFDGHNSADLFRIAKEITNLDAVHKEYGNQYEGDSLYDDVSSELSVTEYQKFLGLATNGKIGDKNYGQSREDIPAGYWLQTTADANVRRTAKLEPRLSFGNNIVKMVKKGKYIGATTGKFVLDEFNKVVFVEFWTFTTKDKKNKQYYFVAKSQVELISPEEKKKREKAGKVILEVLEGTGEARPEVISNALTVVMDEKYRVTGHAPAGIVIGFLIMELKTSKGNFLKVETAQGFTRWVKADTVNVKERN